MTTNPEHSFGTQSAAEQVLRLAERGWPLLPCVTRDKMPLIKSWPKYATVIPQTLTEWLKRWPQCNWGAITGPKSNFFVLDVDGQPGEDAIHHLYALVPASVLDAQNQIRVAVQPLKDKGVSVCEEHGSNQTIVLSSDAVFGSGKSSIGDMKQDGLEVVKSVGEILARMKGTYQRIQIEGHASYESPDLRGPVGGDAADRYGMLNWRLSAERAGAVMQVFIKEGVPDYKISAAARGHYHPVVGNPCNLSINSEYYKQYNKTVEQREQNRRINILIMYGTEEAAK